MHGTMRKTSPALVVIMVLVTGGLVFASGTQEEARETFVSIGTASPAGAYYPLGVAMADIWNRNVDGTQFSAQETGGSVENINLIHSGEIESGLSNENIAYDAIHGHEPFATEMNIVGGWVLNNSNAVFVALGQSGITDVSDLRGRRVALGAPGSSANVFGEMVLAAAGLEEGDYDATYMGWQESADALNDGFIDAAIMVGGQPFPAITSLSVRTSVQVLTFDTEGFREVSDYPYATGVIPASMYDMAQDGDSVLIRSVVYLHPELSDELVYDMVKTVFDNIPTLTEAHPSATGTRLFTRDAAADISLEIHPGVLRYAEEVGEW